MEPDHFHSPLLGCVLRSKLGLNKRHRPDSKGKQYLRQAYCRTHKITVCFCGAEYGWHGGQNVTALSDPLTTPKPVLQYVLDGSLLAEHSSISAASRASGLSVASISYCVNGKIKMAGGYVWKLKN